ncbi:hypothetical protein CSA17_04710 [bacterium DOLJORAL78_65_58]|nr:MAG: hypothetical protein CSA17_04710 [bacterium DOLJORAL78_65_58]
MQLESGTDIFDVEEPVGVLSGRPWQPHFHVDDELLAATRRKVCLPFSVSDHLVRLLAGRGFTQSSDIESYFYPSLTQLHDPFLLLEMDTAVQRARQAASRAEKVAIHGDFDVDGITGCALLCETMQTLRCDGSRARLEEGFIPDRLRDGDGVAERRVRRWAADGVTLLITVDTGASAIREIELASELGMDVIVLDHHIFEERPPAVAVVNPRRGDATYPNDELCGVAVAFKFAQALHEQDPDCLPADFLESVLDLVAMGLVADQMAIVGENRILVKKGLERFNDSSRTRVGLSALLGVSGLDRGFPVTTSDFAYQLAPRINACGRIGRVMSALEMLLTHDEGRARELAREADHTNNRRKVQDQILKKEALEMALPYVQRGDCGLVLVGRNWHKGIIAIGAARRRARPGRRHDPAHPGYSRLPGTVPGGPAQPAPQRTRAAGVRPGPGPVHDERQGRGGSGAGDGASGTLRRGQSQADFPLQQFATATRAHTPERRRPSALRLPGPGHDLRRGDACPEPGVRLFRQRRRLAAHAGPEGAQHSGIAGTALGRALPGRTQHLPPAAWGL